MSDIAKSSIRAGRRAFESLHMMAYRKKWGGEMNVQRRLKKIMAMKKDDRSSALRKLMGELGCSRSEIMYPSSGRDVEPEMVRRIQDAARSIREYRLWWIAFFSAIASVISALAAWTAVLMRN